MTEQLTKAKRPLSVEQKLFRAALLAENVSMREIAIRAGIPPGSMKVTAAHDFPGLTNRSKIEAALEYRWAIWTPRKILQQRRRCNLIFGFDPYTVNPRELVEHGRRIGADLSLCRTRAKKIEAILAKAAVAPMPKNPAVKPSPTSSLCPA